MLVILLEGIKNIKSLSLLTMTCLDSEIKKKSENFQFFERGMSSSCTKCSYAQEESVLQ